MWQAIKWGFGLLIGALLAYVLLWAVLVSGMVWLFTR